MTATVRTGIGANSMPRIFTCILILTATLLPVSGAAEKAEQADRQVVRTFIRKPVPRSTALRLPLGAVVLQEDSDPETWQQTGYLPRSYTHARIRFYQRMEQQGWRRLKIIQIGRPNHPSELTLWQRGSRRSLLMLWNQELGRTGFSWGEERGDEKLMKKASRKAPPLSTRMKTKQRQQPKEPHL